MTIKKRAYGPAFFAIKYNLYQNLILKTYKRLYAYLSIYKNNGIFKNVVND